MAPSVGASHESFDRRDALIIAFCLLLTAWVQRHALGAFFSSPDDLIHLQQAAGLKPTLATPFRFLSQVLYFRLMFFVVGPNPFFFHFVTFALHLVNVVLSYALARSFGVPRRVAGTAAALFGVFPLFLVLLSSGVGMNDELAVTLSLGALLVLRRPGAGMAWIASLLFTLGMLCKESVLLLPLLGLVPRDGVSRSRAARRVMPLLLIGAGFAVLFFLLRPSGLAPDRAIYAMHFGANVFHNLMTYLCWSVNLRDPLPDLISSYDPDAWRVGVWIALALVVAGVVAGRREPAIRLGLLWWILGILPVLPLRFQTYRHYMYPAMFGLALTVAGMLEVVVASVVRRIARDEAARVGPRVTAAILMVTALAYAVRADQLVAARLRTRVPGTQLALDPVIRRREVAEHVIASLASTLPPDTGTKVVILSTWVRVFGARSGSEYAAGTATRAYNLLEESIDHGGAVKLFLPFVDTVAFAPRWSRAHDGFRLFLPYQEGYLEGFPPGPAGYVQAAHWMFKQRMLPQGREFLDSVLVVHPTNPSLHLAHGFALLNLGERAEATTELEAVIHAAPESEEGRAARGILARARGPDRVGESETTTH